MSWRGAKGIKCVLWNCKLLIMLQKIEYELQAPEVQKNQCAMWMQAREQTRHSPVRQYLTCPTIGLWGVDAAK